MRSFRVSVVLTLLVVSHFPASAGEFEDQIGPAIQSTVDQLNVRYSAEFAKLFETFKNGARLSDAIQTRDFSRKFQVKGSFDESDVVTVPLELRDLQSTYLAERRAATDAIIDREMARYNARIVTLTTNDKLDEASVLQKEIEAAKAKYGYFEQSEVAVAATSLPKEIVITKNTVIALNILGQNTTSLTLRTGEKYKLLGVIGNDVYLDLRGSRVKVKIADTDIVNRIENITKGLPEDTVHPSENAQEQPAEPVEVRTPGNQQRQSYQYLTDFSGASVNETDEGFVVARRGGLVLRPGHPKRVVITALVRFDASDSLAIVTRSNLKRFGGYGAFHGVGAMLNQRNNVISIQSLSADALVLKQAPFTFRRGQAYEIQVKDDGNNVSLLIDGNLELSARTSDNFGNNALAFAHESGSSVILKFTQAPF